MSKPNPKNRTCVACRKGQSKNADVLRVIRAPDGDLVVDWRGNLGGRGAYVCPKKTCIEKAIASKAFSRALKTDITYPTQEAFLAMVRQFYRRRIQTYLRSCTKRRAVVPGKDESVKALKAGRGRLLILADDFASRNELESIAAAMDVPVARFGTKDRIGELLGRRPTGVLIICHTELAGVLAETIERETQLGAAD